MAADALTENYGSVALLTPMTPAAHEWIEEHLEIEPWQWIGCSIACEPCCLEHIIEGLQEKGLIVE